MQGRTGMRGPVLGPIAQMRSLRAHVGDGRRQTPTGGGHYVAEPEACSRG